MRASEEITKQRHDRWQRLRVHLRDFGLNEAPPADDLLEPESTTRPNVRLVAYYDEIKQESRGKTTAIGHMGLVVALHMSFMALFISLAQVDQLYNNPSDEWFRNPLLVVTIGSLLTLAAVSFMLRQSRVFQGSLCLTLKELSLSLPDGHRHARWTDVYAVLATKRIRFRQAPCIRVELDDGVVAWLYVAEIDCKPLANLMRDFLLCARNGGGPLCERAAMPE